VHLSRLKALIKAIRPDGALPTQVVLGPEDSVSLTFGAPPEPAREEAAPQKRRAPLSPTASAADVAAFLAGTATRGS